MRLEPVICLLRGHRWRFWTTGPNATDRCLRCYATRPHKPTGLTGGASLWGSGEPTQKGPK